MADHPGIRVIGIIYLYAVRERGKTRTLEALANLCYRPALTETVNPAPLFRFASYLGGTLLVDTTGFWEAAARKGADDFFLARFEKGKEVHRVKRPDAPLFKDLEHYEVFGPTAIATNRPVPSVLESRCFPIRMPAAPGDYAWPIQTEGLELRDRLLGWRAGNIQVELPTLPSTIWRGRFRDICVPLSYLIRLIGKEALEPQLNSLVDALKEMEQVRKEQDRDSLEG